MLLAIKIKIKLESQFSCVAQNIFQCCRNGMGTWWKVVGAQVLNRGLVSNLHEEKKWEER